MTKLANKVPLLDLPAHHAPLREELLAAVRRVMDSGHFILGPEVSALEAEVASYCGARFAVGVSSGTDALLVALMALGVGQGDEVVTPTFSFFATAGVVARLGAKPVFVDIDAKTYNMDPEQIARAITKRTKAIIPVHLYGQCADMEPVLKTAAKFHVPVLEDAAQAIGSQYKDDRRACTLGAAGCLSFFPTKNLGALGDAGMVVTNDPGLDQKLRILRVHGAEPKYYHKTVGGNFRIDALQAALLRVKLGHLDSWSKARRRNAERYASLFKKSGVLDAGLRLPEAAYPSQPFGHIYNQYVVRAPKRDRLRDFLKAEGVDTEVYYPVPLHLQECFKGLGYKAGDFPVAERAAAETVALPVYPEMSEAQQETVVSAVAKFYRD